MKIFPVIWILLIATVFFFYASHDSTHSPKTNATAPSSNVDTSAIFSQGDTPANYPQGSKRQEEQSRVATVKPLQVSAVGLFIEYQKNEVAADKAYKARLLAVRGVVSRIKKDFTGDIFVELASPNEFMNVRAYIDDGNEAKAATLQKGELITVICVGDGLILGSPILKKCSFAPAQPEEESTHPIVQQSVERDPNGIYKIGGAVSAPTLIFSVEPGYSEEARKEKISGTVLVYCVVDTNGNPKDLSIIHGIGKGLDEKAIEAVSKYRFKPAQLNGTAVPVELNVQVVFQIF